MWDKYHYINEIQENDWKIFENTRIRLSHSEFVTLQSNNYAEINGVLSEILRIEWIDEDGGLESETVLKFLDGLTNSMDSKLPKDEVKKKVRKAAKK